MAFPRSATSLLSRLRVSTRMAVLVLLLFGLKLGAAAACVGHDFADLGLGSAGEHATVVKATPGPDGERVPVSPTHAGTCSHGSCHQAADLSASPLTVIPVGRASPEVATAGLPPNPVPKNQLRPPIV